jgi:hypothetical protein
VDPYQKQGSEPQEEAAEALDLPDDLQLDEGEEGEEGQGEQGEFISCFKHLINLMWQQTVKVLCTFMSQFLKTYCFTFK